jgi:hypothetical protein
VKLGVASVVYCEDAEVLPVNITIDIMVIMLLKKQLSLVSSSASSPKSLMR